MKLQIGNYLNLTKPRIVVLFAITGFVLIVAEKTLLLQPLLLAIVMLALMLTAASANAFNMYFDQDIDAIMDRTRFKRAIPLGKLSGKHALGLGFATGILAVFLLLFYSGFLAAVISLFTILFYALVYTKWLKRTTHHNTFWGGFAGATAPLIASAASTGHISALAWSLFGIILIWEPPHFWALAITLKEDYARANIPMLPVKFGEAYTRKAILLYTLLLIPVSYLPYFLHTTSLFYVATTSVLNIVYLWKTIEMIQFKTHPYCRHLFFVSLLYITWLFLFLLMDAFLFFDIAK